MALTNNPKFKIIDQLNVDDWSRASLIHSGGSHDAETRALNGFEVHFTIEINGIKFRIVYETVERYDRLRAWNGYEMSPDQGNTTCQYAAAVDYCIDEDIEGYETFFAQLKMIAESDAADELARYSDEYFKEWERKMLDFEYEYEEYQSE